VTLTERLTEKRWNEVVRRLPKLQRLLEDLTDAERRQLWHAATGSAPPEKKEARPENAD
jgi:hypothetical protein